MLRGCHKPHLTFLAALRMPERVERPRPLLELSRSGPQPGVVTIRLWLTLGWRNPDGWGDQWNPQEALALGNSGSYSLTLNELMARNISLEDHCRTPPSTEAFLDQEPGVSNWELSRCKIPPIPPKGKGAPSLTHRKALCGGLAAKLEPTQKLSEQQWLSGGPFPLPAHPSSPSDSQKLGAQSDTTLQFTGWPVPSPTVKESKAFWVARVNEPTSRTTNQVCSTEKPKNIFFRADMEEFNQRRASSLNQWHHYFKCSKTERKSVSWQCKNHLEPFLMYDR